MKLPNFICVGTQKAGTTSVHSCLIQHPDIFLPEVKETKFFINKEKFEKGIGYYSKEYFGKANNQSAIGEIDPDYMLFEEVPFLLEKLLGKKIKIVIFLRNPMDRAFSHYLMSLRNGYETLNFKDAVLAEQQRINKGYWDLKRYSYINRGLYQKQIANYLKIFPKENIKIYFFETDVKNRLPWLLKDLCEFLEVDSSFAFNPEKKNEAKKIKSKYGQHFLNNTLVKSAAKKIIFSSKYREKIRKLLEEINLEKMPENETRLNNETKKELYQSIFKEEIEKLEILLELELEIWKP